jgi:hypothetical protein
MIVDHISLTTTPIFLSKGDDLVSQGTGFFYIHQDAETLISHGWKFIGVLPNNKVVLERN